MGTNRRRSIHRLLLFPRLVVLLCWWTTTCYDDCSRPKAQATAFSLTRYHHSNHRHVHERQYRSCFPFSPPPSSSSSPFHPQIAFSSSSSSLLFSSSTPLVIIDVENVRGKSAFQWSHEALLVACTMWRNQQHTKDAGGSAAAASFSQDANIALAMVIDHGFNQTVLTGGPLESGVGVFFAGDQLKADDVIVDIVQERSQPPPLPAEDTLENEKAEKEEDSQQQQHRGRRLAKSRSHRNVTTVVTADTELIRRCQYAVARGATTTSSKASKHHHRLTILEPRKFLDQLEQVTHHAETYLRFIPSIFDNKEQVGMEDVTADDVNDSPNGDDDFQLLDPEDDDDAEEVSDDAESPSPSTISSTTELMLRQATVRQELLSLYQQLNPKGKRGKKAGVSRNKRIKLQARLHKTRHRLANVLELTMKKSSSQTEGANATNNDNQNPTNNEELDLDQVAEELIARKRLFSTTTSESTWEREILSQRLQRRLIEAGTTASNDMTIMFQSLKDKTLRSDPAASGSNVHLLESLGQSVNTLRDESETPLLQVIMVPRQSGAGGQDDSAASLPPLRIVAISDTHGFEDQLSQLFPSPDHVNGMAAPPPPHFLFPPADVLIHCGDFYGHGQRSNKSLCMKYLDALLAAQSHIPTKIVIRGNHDPMSPGKALFPRSGAMYATKPMTLTVKGTVLVLVPFSRRTTASFQLPRCDVLVSHEPPFGILDRTYQHKHAGSGILRQAVERVKQKPSLWLCGHIHEGRGSSVHTFQRVAYPGINGDNNNSNDMNKLATPTYVVNAANANWGRANRLVAGPFLVNLGDSGDESDAATKSSFSGMPHFHHQTQPTRLTRPDSLSSLRSTTYVDDEENNESNVNRRLLAVDLGLRTASAVFDSEGNFLSIEQFHFEDATALGKAIPGLIVTNNITHVVVEGEDVNLYDVWTRSVDALRENGFPGDQRSNVQLARITASEWRQELLLPREQKSSRLAKVAAGHIARQVAGDYSGKLTTDAAEAILAGHYALRVLGWSDPQRSAVQRYSNGDVVRDRWSQSRQRVIS